jgi:aminoglycoside phosphotransferase (APT) family kinase protein
VRVPKVLAVCEDPGVIGAPFYIMERVAGEVFADEIPAELDTPEQHAHIADQLIDALVELHRVDWTAIGLDGFGKPSGYLVRQLRRFGGLWEHNRTRELPQVEEVGRWLAANVPASPPATIVHGDFRLGNTMFAAQAPARLVAIFDWEMATIGDPLADVGYMLMHWTQPGDALGKFNAKNVTLRPGFPTRAELTAAYEERSGRSVQALDWYVTLALWKAVVFMEGNYKRALAGSVDDPYLKSFGEGVIEIADRALTVTRNGF